MLPAAADRRALPRGDPPTTRARDVVDHEFERPVEKRVAELVDVDVRRASTLPHVVSAALQNTAEFGEQGS